MDVDAALGTTLQKLVCLMVCVRTYAFVYQSGDMSRKDHTEALSLWHHGTICVGVRAARLHIQSFDL